MTELEEAWLEAYIETGDAETALEEAGSQCSTPESRRTRASYLKRKHAEEIGKRMREKFGSDAPMHYSTVRKLSQGAKSEDVRLKAARDGLDRGGYKAPERHEHTVRHEGEITAEIRALIASMDPQTLRDAGLAGLLDGDVTNLEQIAPAERLEAPGNETA